MSRNTAQKADSLSGIEYLSLAIQAASRLKVKTIPLSVEQAKEILAEIETLRLGELAIPPPHTPPPLDVTSLTPAEVSQRTPNLPMMFRPLGSRV